MIGIFGGTFDPVHFGHLRTALELAESLPLTQIRLTPCRLPPHRQRPGASAEQRLAMLRSAVANESALYVDTQELERDGPSYSVDTLSALRTEFGPDHPLCLIVGMDAFASLERWHRWQTLFELAHIVVIRRPRTAPHLPPSLTAFIEQRTARHADRLLQCPSGLVLFQQVIQLDISATRIRDLIREGKNPRYLLPESALALIREQQIYT